MSEGVESLFQTALRYVKSGSGSVQPSQSQQLSMYALFKQAENGPNETPRPSAFDFVGRAKWDSWKKLGDISRSEAMTKYIQLLDSMSPEWRTETGPAASAPAVRLAPTSAPVARAEGAAPGGGGASTSGPPLIIVDKYPTEGVAVVRMNRKPVNSLNTAMFSQIAAAVKELEKDRTVDALVLTTALPTVFSAGLDITEMYKTDRERFFAFWNGLRNCFLTLYASPLITVAAIQGACPAAGCLFSMACDYRVMLKGPYKIGLNETKLGIVAPEWFVDVFVRTVGHRQAERHLELGSLLNPEHALSIGLVDELVDDPAALLTAAKRTIKELQSVNATARRLTKSVVRKDFISKMKKNPDTEFSWGFLGTEPVQKALEKYMQSLRAKL